MATPPVKPTTAPPKPNPLHGAPPPAAPVETTKATQLQLDIHGIPPKPNMAELASVEETHISESTRDELEAGRKAVSLSEERRNAEFEAGKKAIAHLQHNSKSEEPPPSQP